MRILHDWQESLSKSNEAFTTFKKESDRLQKKMKAVEKEKRELSGPLDKSNAKVKEAKVKNFCRLRAQHLRCEYGSLKFEGPTSGGGGATAQGAAGSG